MLEINDLSKSFGRFSINNINLHVEKDDYFILLGSSGAGKSVLLEIIAGLIRPDQGRILLNGRDITALPVDKRRTGLIFQSPAIFPHMTVKQNILYPLRHLGRKDASVKMLRLAELMRIRQLLEQRPSTLSGGELQRVALARTLASDPLMLLLDEPLSAIDTPLKTGLRGLLRELNLNGMPVMHVTHDFDEAFALATRMAVIENGRIVQSGNPSEILSAPKTGFTAGFSGEHNFFKAEIDGKTARVRSGKVLNDWVSIQLDEEPGTGPASILVKSRFVSITIDKAEQSADNAFRGVVSSLNPVRDGFEVCINCELKLYARVSQERFAALNLKPGMHVWAGFDAAFVDVIR